MMADPKIDVVYVATVHPRHLPDALAAIEAGKHVLVEKPLALNASEAQRGGASQRRVSDGSPLECVFAEIRRYPAAPCRWRSRERADGDRRPWRMVSAGAQNHALRTCRRTDAGPRNLSGRFCDRSPWSPGPCHSHRRRCAKRCERASSVMFSHPGGAQSVLHTTIRSHTPGDAVVSGTDGMLTIPGRFYTPGPFTVTANDLTTRLIFDEPRNHYAQLFHQAIHLVSCVADNRLESPIRTLEDSLVTLEAIDEIRHRLNIVFPHETTGARL
jgi:predicted dehydrogenase